MEPPLVGAMEPENRVGSAKVCSLEMPRIRTFSRDISRCPRVPPKGCFLDGENAWLDALFLLRQVFR